MNDLKLNPAVQGVDFTLSVPGGGVRVFVAAEVLAALGAGARPKSWLEVAARHAPALRALALAMHRDTGSDLLIVTPKEAAELMETSPCAA